MRRKLRAASVCVISEDRSDRSTSATMPPRSDPGARTDLCLAPILRASEPALSAFSKPHVDSAARMLHAAMPA